MGRHHVCAACGSENPPGARFCNSCGAALTTPVVERRKLVTSVFCDLSGSTALGESADAESVFELMRSYFDTARAALERHGGTVEKFIGDAVVGMFGVPEAHEDDALRACRAALEIQERMTALELGVAVRIGVNTGEVVAGDAARREMFAAGDAVVLGDSVNVAARLEQAAAAGEVLIGEATYRLVSGAVTVEPVEPISAKGKAEPLSAYRLLAASTHGPLPRRAASRLVGREHELAILEAELDPAAGCRLITVVGEAGVGKSRLLAELAGRVGARARIVRGGCLSYGEGITFWALAQIVRELAGIHDDHTAEEARTRVPPRIAQLLGLAEGSSTPDQAAQAVADFLAAAAAGQPLVVLVDDVHWAEPALLDLLAGLPAKLENAPILLVCLARPELLELRPDWAPTVRLEPLAPGEIDALLEALEAPAETRVRLAQAAAGNPLFAEELVAWVREGGDADALPTSLNALLGARLDRLTPEARNALERGAVEGELFHQDTVVELSDEQSRPAVPGELGTLARTDLIRIAAAGLVASEVAYRFKHILVREAAYRGTAKKLRAALHERFADWLERIAGERVGEYQEILGYHLEQAYRYRTELGPVDDDARALAGRAARHLFAAGRRANDRSDVVAAANLLGRAAALLPPDSLERLELMLPYRYALFQSGRIVEAVAIWEEMDERATALGERGLAAHARVSYAAFRIFNPGVDLDEVQSICEEGIAIFTELGDEAGLAGAKRQLGSVCRVEGRRAEAAVWFEQALVHANSCGDQVTRRLVTESLAQILGGGPMPVDEATNRCEELREANSDDRVLEALIARCLSALLAMAGRFEDARELAHRSTRVLEEANTTASRQTLEIAAEAKELAGDRAGALQDLDTMWLSSRDTLGGAPTGNGMSAAFQLAYIYCDDGRWEEAEKCLAFYRDVPDPTGPVVGTARRLAATARVAAHRGELAEAAKLARRAVELTDPTDMLNIRARVMLALAEVQRAGGNDEEADAASRRALELYEEKGNIAAAAALRAAAHA